MTDTSFGLGPIGQVRVPVTDVEHAAAFYRDGATGLWMCFTKDPDGNNVGLMSEVTAGAGRTG